MYSCHILQLHLQTELYNKYQPIIICLVFILRGLPNVTFIRCLINKFEKIDMNDRCNSPCSSTECKVKITRADASFTENLRISIWNYSQLFSDSLSATKNTKGFESSFLKWSINPRIYLPIKLDVDEFYSLLEEYINNKFT